MNLNKVMLIGRMTRQPETRNTPGGTVVCSFSLATNRVYTSNGAKKEETEFTDVVAFGKQAETIAKYVGKGDILYVEGRLKKSSWEDKKDGSKKYRTDVILEKFEFGQKSAANRTAKPAQEEIPEDDGSPKAEDTF